MAQDRIAGQRRWPCAAKRSLATNCRHLEFFTVFAWSYLTVSGCRGALIIYPLGSLVETDTTRRRALSPGR